MYEIRPIITLDAPTKLPNCMYKLKNIHADLDNVLEEKSLPPGTKKVGTFKQVEQFLKNIENREMAALEDRQEKLLSQLEELKKIMESIKSNLNKSSNTPNSCNKTAKISSAAKVNNIPDIVINVNPRYPPYFLLFLQRLLKNEISLNITCHLHSSVSEISGKSEAFISNLEKFPTNGVPSMNIRLIWKNIGPNAELSVSRFPVQGEANILRFLARTLDAYLGYEKNPNVAKIDYLLDLSYKLSNTNSKSSRSGILQCLSKHVLPNFKWLGGQNKITIADIAVYDSLVNFANKNEISGDLNKWFNNCEGYIKS
ncbi:hypothetical protein HHI36_007373 [Cryptolaemus montrouzieri]|uniref:Aminoacyl tRNA synthase complex-interacting multifunctional protein 2 n=1 Tax=Cryptolaemus montrouzieri TaxID=559131 RepID=A0ABD2MPT9_9CUCU